MAIKRSSQVGTPFGTTANRPANPAVGQTYYNGTLGYLEIYTSAGWAAAAKGIAFGNTANRPASPDLGTPYFNGQEARLELYTSNGWQNIVQETPSVVSIVGQLNESTTSTLTINGTNFATGAIAYVVGTNGVETVANTTTLVSVVEITAVFPALPPANGPYDVKVVNTSNLYGVLYETLGVNDNPVWSTSSGSLGTFTELDVVSVTVAATDATDSTNSPLQYTLVSGSLPTGFSLNSTTGVISGTALDSATNTTYSFTIGASDSRNTVQTRAFSITINDRNPVWTTGTVLPVFTSTVAYSTTVSATEDESGAITYSLVSGSLPTGLTLSSSGTISGTPTSLNNTSFTIRATVTASGTTADRAFTMANVGTNAPVWTTAAGALTSGQEGSAYSLQLSATDDSGSAPSYSIFSGSLPTGLTLSSSGLISGTPSSGGVSSFTVNATDSNQSSTSRAFTISVAAVVVQTFTSSGNWTAPSGLIGTVQYLIAAGGGGGAGAQVPAGGGAGGAGGYLAGTVTATPGTTYTIVVGGGGSSGGTNSNGATGNNSSFSLVGTTALGGGFGGLGIGTGAGSSNAGGNGGSGGGGGGSGYGGGGAGGLGTAGQGFNGFSGSVNGGAGGGAGGPATGRGADCGPGVSNSISGSSVVYCSGGRQDVVGAGVSVPNRTANLGLGGDTGPYVNPGTSYSGNGGSGVVILKYYV